MIAEVIASNSVVVLDGFSSSYQPVTSGVPQGSIIGPLLYIIFVNSISKLPLSPGAKLVLYADDILLYKPVNCEMDSHRTFAVLDRNRDEFGHHLICYFTSCVTCK